jgi:A/G-specific adenine glycosylase
MCHCISSPLILDSRVPGNVPTSRSILSKSKFDEIRLRETILIWGKSNYRAYPWRTIENPWLALLAEMFLQRTNANHVNRHFAEICAEFPTPKSVLEKKPEEIEQIVHKFGMRRRLRTIVELAEFIESKDIYPTELEELKSIYGIGHYTASAYLSLHMNRRAVIVDANVARWLARLTGNEKPVDVRRCQWVWDLAEHLTPKRRFKDYNYAVLDFTMVICLPRKPKCAQCPFERICRYAT